MSITVTPVLVADLGVEGERMPVYACVVDHPDARVLVDTGIKELHPLTIDLDPRPRPPEEWGIDLASIDIVVNTHLHFDHCGNNHLFAGTPIYVQRRELDDALTLDDYTIRDWIQPSGVQYVAVDGELELLPGVRLVPAPGHPRIANPRPRHGRPSDRPRRRHGGLVRRARRAADGGPTTRARNGTRAGVAHAHARSVAARRRPGVISGRSDTALRQRVRSAEQR